MQILAVALPFDFHTVAITPEYWVLIACSECGFYSEEGAGSKFALLVY